MKKAMKRLVAFAALMLCGGAWAETTPTADESGTTPTYWLKFNGDFNSSGSQEITWGNSEKTSNFVDVGGTRDKAMKVVSGSTHPYSLDTDTKYLGGGDFTFTLVARTARAYAKTVLVAIGTTNNFVGFYVNPTGDQISFGTKDKVYLTADVPTAMLQYHSYVVTKSGNSLILYVDGVQTDTSEEAPNCDVGGCQIGAARGGVPAGFVRFTGSLIDDVRIYQGTVLNQAAITAFANTFAVTPTISNTAHTASISSNVNFTQAGWDVPWTGATADSVTINVTADCTLTVNEDRVVRELTFNVSQGKTLTLIGSKSIIARDAKLTGGGTLKFTNTNGFTPFGGTAPFLDVENSIIELQADANWDYSGISLAGITGTGKMKLSAGNFWQALPVAAGMWSTTLDLENNLANQGLILTEDSSTYNVANLSGSGKFRYDWGTRNTPRTLNIIQSKDTEWSGGLYNNDARFTKVVVKGAPDATSKTLTYSGANTTPKKGLEVDASGSLKFTGSWNVNGTLLVNGEFGGSGTISGATAVTVGNGAKIRADWSGNSGPVSLNVAPTMGASIDVVCESIPDTKKIKLFSGTITASSTTTLARVLTSDGESYDAQVSIETDGVYATVVEPTEDQAGAKIGDKFYLTLVVALDNAVKTATEANPVTVMLLKANSESVNIPANVIVDTNGQTMSGAVSGQGKIQVAGFGKISGSTIKNSLKDSSNWTGTLVVTQPTSGQIGAGDGTVVSGGTKTLLNDFGNEKSAIEFSNCTASGTTNYIGVSYNDDNDLIVIKPEIVVTGTMYLGNGYSHTNNKAGDRVNYTVIRKLSGTGAISCANASQLFYILDGTDFEGSITSTTKKFVFGERPEKIYVADNTIANGEIVIRSTAAAPTVKASWLTSKLTIEDDQTLTVDSENEVKLRHVTGGSLIKGGTGTLKLQNQNDLALGDTTVTINKGKVELCGTEDSIGDAIISNVKFVIGAEESAVLDNHGYFTVNGSLTIKNETDKTVFTNRGPNNAKIKGTGLTFIKEGSGVLTLQCIFEQADEPQTAKLNGGSLVVKATLPENRVTTDVENKVVTYNETTKTYSLVDPVAEYNGTKYATLEEAINAALGRPITLLANATGPAGCYLINANGHTFSVGTGLSEVHWTRTDGVMYKVTTTADATIGQKRVESNKYDSISKFDGAIGVAVNALFIPSTAAMPKGSKVTIQSIGLSYRETGYPSSITLAGASSTSCSSTGTGTVRVGANNGVVRWVRYAFDDIEVTVGEEIAITDSTFNAQFTAVAETATTALRKNVFQNSESLIYEIQYTVKAIALKPGAETEPQTEEPTEAQLAEYAPTPVNDDAAAAGQAAILKVVSKQLENGKWVITVDLDTEKMPEGKEIDDSALAFAIAGLDAIAGSTETQSVVIDASKVTPGAYYSVIYGDSPTALSSEGMRALATSAGVTITVPAMSGKKVQFFRVKASANPTAN